VIYTEEEARAKSCPFKSGRPPYCDGSQCMAWRALDREDGKPERGYCMMVAQGAVTELTKLLVGD
jgi:hypothetical protein